MPKQHFFEYGEREILWLESRDPVLGREIYKRGHIYRRVIPDLFTALLNSISGQQISAKAHETVWKRIEERFKPLRPETINSISADELRACGMSMRKASYIKGAAELILNGELNMAALKKLSDDDVCKTLCKINGIGIWTAEMLMIFSLQRMDILSWGDLAIKRGLSVLYRHREITPRLFEKYRRLYSPYASVASLYLWEISREKS